jgi:uncharacterized membrane protein
MSLLPVHIVAGITAIISGFIAAFALKGADLHRKTGTVFVYAMLILAFTGATMAFIKHQTGNLIGASIAFYLVTTGLLTVRPRDKVARSLDIASLLIGTTLGILCFKVAIDGVNSPSGTVGGIPPGMIFFFGTAALLGAAGDMRVLLTGGLQGAHRIARHLWRMCFALFVASGSFFLGQAKVFPKPIRILPLLAIPALLPLVLLIYWLARVLFTKWYRRRAVSFKRAPVGSTA